MRLVSNSTYSFPLSDSLIDLRTLDKSVLRAALARDLPRPHARRRSPEDGRGGARMSWETADLGVIAVLALVLCALLPNVLAVKRRLRNAATKR